jgi:hypothetical protein
MDTPFSEITERREDGDKSDTRDDRSPVLRPEVLRRQVQSHEGDETADATPTESETAL